MKKLNITQGSRMPFWMRDLEYMMKSSSEVFEAILEGLSLGTRDFIISGCAVTVTNSKVSMTGGWCYYGGEVLPVLPLPPTTYGGANPMIKFTKVTRHDPEGDRVIELEGASGMSQVYRDDCLQPSLATGMDVYRLAIGRGAWNLGERITNTARQIDSGVVEAVTVVPEAVGTVRYRQVGGVVQLCGSLAKPSGGFNGLVAQGLPRPAVRLVLPAGDKDGSMQIDIDGTLSVATFANSVNLDHVMYIATPAVNTDDKHYSTIHSQGGEI